MKKLVFSFVAVLLLAASCSMDGGAGEPFLPPDMGDAKDLEASGATSYPESDEELKELVSAVGADLLSYIENERSTVTDPEAGKTEYELIIDEGDVIAEYHAMEEMKASQENKTVSIKQNEKGSFSNLPTDPFTVSGKLQSEQSVDMSNILVKDDGTFTCDVKLAYRVGYALSICDTQHKGGKVIMSFAVKGKDSGLTMDANVEPDFVEILQGFLSGGSIAIYLYNDDNELLREVHCGLDELMARK